MANWQTYKINELGGVGMSYIRFALDEKVYFYNNHRSIYIDFARQYPFTSYRAGDHVEIDLDKTCQYKSYDVIVDSSIIRRISSSAVVSGSSTVGLPSVSQNQVNTMIGQINSAINSDERNEYEAKIHVDPQ